jgi:excisionase family DNA binding protein
MTTRRSDLSRRVIPADLSRANEDSAPAGQQHRAGVLYTPAEAAARLAVPESWLRRKAGQRLIPCTKLGKHLRFSPDDLASLAQTGAQAPRTMTASHGRR